MFVVLAVVAVALVVSGAYLEHKLGSKIASRVATLESKVSAVESAAAAVKKAV